MHPHSLQKQQLHKTLLIKGPEGANQGLKRLCHGSDGKLLAWVQFQASLSEICDGRNGPGTGFCLSTLVSPTQYHSTIQSSIKITLTNDIIVQNHTQEGFQVISCILILSDKF
jgi:hypothetical protein